MAGSLQPHFLGKIVEICIVTADHRRTIEGLLRFGIGPFRIHTFNASCVQSQKYYGQPTEFELQVCFATQGAVVWEIMQPVSGLSVMADFLAKHGEGIHHVAFDCDQVPVQQRRDEFAKRGFQIAQEGVWQGKRGTCHFMFWDTEDATTTCFETYHFSSDWVDPNDTEWYPSPPTKVSTLLTDPQSTAGHPAGNDKGIIRASKGKGIVLAKGQCLKVINTHGKQVIDFFAFALDSRLQPPTAAALEFLSMQHTRSGNLHINPRAGSTLFSNLRKPMFTFVEDTSPGIHDSLVPACDPERYRQLGAQGHHAVRIFTITFQSLLSVFFIMILDLNVTRCKRFEIYALPSISSTVADLQHAQ